MKKLFSKIKSIKTKLGKWFWVIVIVLVLVLGGYFIFGRKQKTDTLSATVQKGEIKEELILSGEIQADKHAMLTFPTSGKISWVGVKEGQLVYRGQALASLDKTELNIVYQQALNNYKNYQAAAESTLDSVKNHSTDETFIQKASRTAAEVARDNSYDAVKAAEYNLRNATLTAPFAGVITSLPFPSPGVNIMVTSTMVEILDPSSIYFEVNADQSEVVELKDGQEVKIILDSYDGELIGKVVFISYTPKSGETGTVYKVRVNFSENITNGNILRIGMTGDAKFILSQKEGALYVPLKFVNSDKSGKYVYLGSKKNKVYVTTGIEGEENIEITEGVKEGDVIYD